MNTVIIQDEQSLKARLNAIEMIARKGLPGGPVLVELKRKKRSAQQNKLFHAMCGEVAKKAVYMGHKRSLAQWKVLFVSAHSIATGKGAEVLQGLEGEFVNIREETSRMSVSRLNSLIEYVNAWCSDNDIKLTDHTYLQ